MEDCKQYYNRECECGCDCHKSNCDPCCEEDGFDWITWGLILIVVFLLCSPKDGGKCGLFGGLF